MFLNHIRLLHNFFFKLFFNRRQQFMDYLNSRSTKTLLVILAIIVALMKERTHKLHDGSNVAM